MVSRDGRIVLVNAQTEEIFGYRRGELIGCPVEVLVPDRVRDTHATAHRLLQAIGAHRAKAVGMDLTGVAPIDATVANALVQTVVAARLQGATVIVTGISPETAQAAVHIGVDLRGIATAGDLQRGIERAESLLGYTVARIVPFEGDRPALVSTPIVAHDPNEEPPLEPLLPRRVRFTHRVSAGSPPDGRQQLPSPRVTLEDNSGDRAMISGASGAPRLSCLRHISRKT